MKRPLIFLMVSLAGNALLAMALLREPAGTSSVSDSATGTNGSQSDPSWTHHHSAVGGTNVVIEAVSFKWSQIESSDYVEYIKRLRAFGVPEKVIRDIIIADVSKIYRPKLAALRSPKQTSSRTNYWEQRGWFSPNRGMTQEQKEQARALRKEERELIQTLLGKDVYKEMAKESPYPDYTERSYGSISEDKRDAVSEIQQRYQEKQSEIMEKAQGYIDGETQGDINALTRKQDEELAKILTPEELTEYKLRNSDVASNIRWQLGPFDPSEAEFRAIFAYKEAVENLKPSQDPDDPPPTLTNETVKEQRQKQKDLEAALTQALGPDRASQYKLMDDGAYRNLLDSGATMDSVMKLPDLQKQANDAAQKIRSDNSLTAEQRDQALKDIQTETQKTLADLLGERRAKAYAGNGGWWIRNIAPNK